MKPEFQYFFLILLAILLLIGCFWQHAYITRTADDLSKILETLCAEIHRDAFADAKSSLSEFSAKWQTHRRTLYSLVEHDLIYEIDAEFAALHADLMKDNAQQLPSTAARLQQAVRALARPERLTLSNIF